ncbi:MAG: hypothetical protein KGD73_04185 [Candidatus Lokiarchaeota archaeon]|nr:hypothetical protein [Candidatus Lokiarchaeota archaeon]
MQTQKIDEVFELYYENMRKSIKGVEEILKINFLEKDIYYKMGIDNLNALHENIVDLLKHTYSPREVRMKLREIEYDEKITQETFLE